VTYAGIQDHVLGSEEEGRAVRVGRVRDLIDEQSVVGPVKVLQGEGSTTASRVVEGLPAGCSWRCSRACAGISEKYKPLHRHTVTYGRRFAVAE
jgi:hypothetical protein